MEIRYINAIGEPVTVDWEQFREDFKDCKVVPNQNVIANGTPIRADKMIKIIETADDNANYKGALKAKREDELFQKTAPWWLKRIPRGLIQIAWIEFMVCACMFKGALGGVIVTFLYMFYMALSGANRYNQWFDLFFINDYDDAIEQHQLKKGKGKNKGD